MRCPKCSSEIKGGSAECPRCGVIIEKHLAARRRKAVEAKRERENEKRKERPAPSPPLPPKKPPRHPRVDCPACKTSQSMVATQIPRFSAPVRLVGYIIALPSVVGMASAALLVIVTTANVSSVAHNGAAAGGSGLSYAVAVMVAVASLASGLLGWLLIMKKKVFKCEACGFVMDRA